ncbi:MAG: carboxypeptidase-like regulatory domain-containing protein, partial [Bacteroidota bacterium]
IYLFKSNFSMKSLLLFLIFSLLLFCKPLISQTPSITGQVIDQTNKKPISGVAILINPSENNGVTSDKEGTFQLIVNQLPIELSLSHIGYESKTILLQSVPDSNIVIDLKPKVHVIKEALVSSKQNLKTLSEPEQYSVLDFEMDQENILLLQYHGSFKRRRIALINLEGAIQDLVILDKIKNATSLYRSCNNLIYLLNAAKAFPILIENNRIQFLASLPIDNFNRFVRSCKFKEQNSLYYLIKEFNGLKQSIKKYELATSEVKTIKVLLHEQIQSYFSERVLKYTQVDTDQIQNNDRDLNQVLRRIQGDIEFYTDIFYRPSKPICIFAHNKRLVVFNHPDDKIEIFKNDTFEKSIGIEYSKSKKWLKKIIQDQKTMELYGLFKNKYGTAIKLLDIDTGNLEAIENIDAYLPYLKKVRVFDGQLYYLKENPREGNRVDLLKQNIG